MNKSVIYIVGATVFVGGAYLFLKNKKAKDLSKLAETGGTTTGGTTTGGTTTGGTTTGGTTSVGTTSGGTTSGGTSGGTTTSNSVSSSNANINLANATVVFEQRVKVLERINVLKRFVGVGSANSLMIAQQKVLAELDQKLVTLGYKVDAIGQLVKI